MNLYEKYGVGASFILIALIILFAGILPNLIKIIDRKTSENYILIEAEISNINVNEITPTRINHDVFVKFEMEDREYEVLLDTYVEGMQVGEKVEIYCDATNPQNITLKWNQLMQLVVFSFLDVIFSVIGVILIKRKQKTE